MSPTHARPKMSHPDGLQQAIQDTLERVRQALEQLAGSLTPPQLQPVPIPIPTQRRMR